MFLVRFWRYSIELYGQLPQLLSKHWKVLSITATTRSRKRIASYLCSSTTAACSLLVWQPLHWDGLQGPRQIWHGFFWKHSWISCQIGRSLQTSLTNTNPMYNLKRLLHILIVVLYSLWFYFGEIMRRDKVNWWQPQPLYLAKLRYKVQVEVDAMVVVYFL